MPPDEVVRQAKDYDACVTFTYSEPIVFLEYCIDTAAAARKAGVRTTMVTGGSGEAEPMKEALKHLDAVKVDLKGFTEDYYQRMCKGKLEPVLKTLEVIRASGVWLELVHLCVPGQNDSETEILAMCRWVKGPSGRGRPRPLHALSPGIPDEERRAHAQCHPDSLPRNRRWPRDCTTSTSATCRGSTARARFAHAVTRRW